MPQRRESTPIPRQAPAQPGKMKQKRNIVRKRPQSREAPSARPRPNARCGRYARLLAQVSLLIILIKIDSAMNADYPPTSGL
jgi:hypothetical protein